jgi:uroporphyrinogen decarboxylase
MHPESFDEYVVPYDGAIVSYLRERGIPVNCHCHGKISHALRCMINMGFDSTDPTEPPPAGDVTFAEAREIAGDEITLLGNLEFDELENASADHIKKRVREILAFGNRRVIVSASAGPISRVTPRLAENYRAMVDTALEYGG